MSLTPGQRLGSYEVVSPLGAGGMGEVYRARDPKLDREVAIKVLPERVAGDDDALARFEREAKTIAALSHPNLVAIFDFGKEGSVAYAVMELLEGETLRQALSSGALPVRKAVEYGVQIAHGLASAHEKGIVHRDLKPDNVFITSDGRLKVLDFGLAAHRAGPDEGGGTKSPTKTSHTDPGTVLGTAGYMSPEQVKGLRVDHRTDIFALGVVLYEMLTGRRAFHGDTAAETMAAILKEDVAELSGSGRAVPLSLDRLVRRCLEKRAEERFQSARDLAISLEAYSGSDLSQVMPAIPDAQTPWRRWRAPIVAAAICLMLGLLAGRWLERPAPKSPGGSDRVIHGEILLPIDAPLALRDLPPVGFLPPLLAISPDGGDIVYVGESREGGRRLYHRSLSGTDIKAIPGTEGAINAFFSPDGRNVGFLTPDQVKRVALDGTSAAVLANTRSPVHGFWPDGGFIYVAEAQGQALVRVSENGGRPDPLAAETVGHVGLPLFTDVGKGGDSALITLSEESSGRDNNTVFSQVLASEVRTPILERGYGARLSGGRLLFVRGGDLFAQPMDSEGLRPQGGPSRIVSGVNVDSIFGGAQYAASANGTVVYSPGEDTSIGRPAWVSRQGKASPIMAFPEKVYGGSLDASSTGDSFVVQTSDVPDFVWLFDASRSETRRLALEGSTSRPVLSREGGHVFVSTRSTAGTWAMWRSSLAGSERLRIIDGLSFTAAGSPADRPILRNKPAGSDQFKTGVVDLTTQPPRPGWLEVDLGNLGLSQDGRWLSGASDKTGRTEVFLHSVEANGREFQISTDGGIEPLFCGDTLNWRKGGQWYSSAVDLRSAEPRWAPPVKTFQTDFLDTVGMSYALSDDCQRLLVIKRSKEPDPTRLRFITNFPALMNAQKPQD